MPIGYHGQLIDVLAAHQLEGLGRESVGSDGAQFAEWAHRALHAGLRPVAALNCLNLVGRDQAHNPIALGDEKTMTRSEEHTSELQSRPHLVCRLLLEK